MYRSACCDAPAQIPCFGTCAANDDRPSQVPVAYNQGYGEEVVVQRINIASGEDVVIEYAEV